MRNVRFAALIAVLAPSLVIGRAPVQAADLGPQYFQPPPIEQMVEYGSGWYLRGDLGYVDVDAPIMTATAPNLSTSAVTSGDVLFSSKRHHDSVLGATLGAGYRFNNWLRADLTYDWRDALRLNNGNVRSGCVLGTETATSGLQGDCYFNDTGTFHAWTGLANLYVDLGTWSGVTPYIGGGIGFTRMQASGQEAWFWGSGQPYGNSGFNTYCFTQQSSGQQLCKHYGYPGNQGPKQNRTTFSGAGMAGISFALSQLVKLDIGYRYLYMGSVRGIDASGRTSNRTVDSQEVRAGLRITPDGF